MQVLTILSTIITIFFLTNGVLIAADESCQVDPLKLTDACKFGGVEIINTSNDTVVNDENCGMLVNKSTFDEMPKITWASAKCPMSYVLMMIDPDAPGEPGEFFVHMMLNRVKCDDLKNGSSLDGAKTAIKYKAPDPQPTMDNHRYMFLVYEQKKSAADLEAISEHERLGLSLSNYLAPYERDVCGPVAGIQFLANMGDIH